MLCENVQTCDCPDTTLYCIDSSYQETYSQKVEKTPLFPHLFRRIFMRRVYTLLLAGLLVAGIASQSLAASVQTKEHELPGMSITIPASWNVLTKAALKQFEAMVKGVELLLVAEGDNAGFLKFSVMRRGQAAPSQLEFEAMGDDVIKDMCEQFAAQTQGQGATEFRCTRIKTAKGSALAVNYLVPTIEVMDASYTFFQGPTQITVVSAQFKKEDAAQVMPTLENVVKSVKLGK